MVGTEFLLSAELKVVMTLPLQTISAASEWFTSSADRVNGFEDRILWKEDKLDEPPLVRSQYIIELPTTNILVNLNLFINFSNNVCSSRKMVSFGHSTNPAMPTTRYPTMNHS